MMYGMGFGYIFGIIVLLIFGWGLFNLTNINREKSAPFKSAGKTDGDSEALQILKQRYARGEISKEQYEVIKQDITKL